jgi:hypothetical protein
MFVATARCLLSLSLVWMISSVGALESPPSTVARIAKLYSTLDGTVQLVELEIVRVGDTPLVLAGRNMTVTDRRGNTRSFHLNGAADGVANRPTLLIMASVWLDDMTVADGWWQGYADLPMPRYFLPIDGGKLSIEGMDEITFERLPSDGRSALNRDGTVAPAKFEWGSFDSVYTVVREFHHPLWDHYFMTNRVDEVRLLVSGALTGWQPTGKALYLYSRKLGPQFFPVCRYMLQRPDRVSHFFSALANECTVVANDSNNVLETDSAFYAGLPSDNGSCDASATIVFANGSSSYGKVGAPIYRLWNAKADTNHRYVASKVDRDTMIASGWISEGYGVDGVEMCGYWVDAPPLPQ